MQRGTEHQKEHRLRSPERRARETQSLSPVILVDLVPQEFHFITLLSDGTSAVLQPGGSTGKGRKAPAKTLIPQKMHVAGLCASGTRAPRETWGAERCSQSQVSRTLPSPSIDARGTLGAHLPCGEVQDQPRGMLVFPNFHHYSLSATFLWSLPCEHPCEAGSAAPHAALEVVLRPCSMVIEDGPSRIQLSTLFWGGLWL